MDVCARYASVLERLDKAVSAAGRKREEVTLVAVSKLHAAEDVARVAAAGQVDFGENYVQEALQKRQDLAADPACAHIRWHMIGHVQSRKAPLVAGAFALLHTLDSRKLADGLEKRLAALDAAPRCDEILEPFDLLERAAGRHASLPEIAVRARYAKR